MKIEKINDNQIKIILNQIDLDARNIRITELAYGSEKTQALFREMMEQALAECGFDANNVPLMIEAIPFAHDSITIIVTKVTNVTDIEERFNMLPRSKDIAEKAKKKLKQNTETTDNIENPNIFVFSFENLDHVTSVSLRLYGTFFGENILFKNYDKYFMFLEKSKDDIVTKEDLNSILSEYGQKHISSNYSKQYLLEHGEVIIKNSAIDILCKYLA